MRGPTFLSTLARAQMPCTCLPPSSQGAFFFPLAAPPNPNREVAGDTIIFRDTQISSRAVYQCNTSNEHGYLLANAFVSVLGEPLLPVYPQISQAGGLDDRVGSGEWGRLQGKKRRVGLQAELFSACSVGVCPGGRWL